MDLGLKDKVAIITGGAKGIGAAIVKAYAKEGGKVVIANRPGPAGPAVIEEIKAAGGEGLFVEADLADLSTCDDVISKTLAAYGRIDCIVNNAGVNDGVDIEKDGIERIKASMDVNLYHVWYLVKLALPHLKEHKGNVVNISSKVSVTGQGNTNGYAISKGAMNALTREWAIDFAKYGVRVNCIIPAEVWTPQYESWMKTLGDDAKAVYDRICSTVPLDNRFTTSEEIADMAVFIASERSSHTTGQILSVDGGYVHLDRAFTVA